MGLFSAILGGMGGAVGDIFSAQSNKSAIKNAASAQTQALQQALGLEQQARTDNMPFLNAGTGAVEQIRRLLGLGDSNTGVSVNGNPAYSAAEQQAGALGNLKDSPLFTSRYNTGLDAILQGASATGGLRGGNTENSLAEFGSGLFGDVYNSTLSQLFGLTGVGQSAGNTLTGVANQQANLTTQQGNVQAGSILGRQAVDNNLTNQLQSLLKSVTGGAAGMPAGGSGGFGF